MGKGGPENTGWQGGEVAFSASREQPCGSAKPEAGRGGDLLAGSVMGEPVEVAAAGPEGGGGRVERCGEGTEMPETGQRFYIPLSGPRDDHRPRAMRALCTAVSGSTSFFVANP
jgi:hypothetical protein